MLQVQNGNTRGGRWYDPYNPRKEFDDDNFQYTNKGEGWRELDMSHNGLRSLSLEIRHFSHITALYLNNNKLNALPQEFFHELRALITLDLSYNVLLRLPPGISNLIHLEKLSLSSNRITELPVEMGQLYHLKEMDLSGNPLVSPPHNIVDSGTNNVISYLRDRMPMGPPPPERKFISYLDSSVTIPDKDKFKVLSYNILAESYASLDRYYYCPSWALDWNYRKQGILKELLSYDADILCLQEVESGQYNSFFKPELAKVGYIGVLVPKSRARTMSDWNTVDGCAIFYKRSK
jgi:CCR4-NOT transcription complex subunit 6